MMNIVVIIVAAGLAKATRRHQKAAAFRAGGDGVQVQDGGVGQFFHFLFQPVVAVLIAVVTILDTGDLRENVNGEVSGDSW